MNESLRAAALRLAEVAQQIGLPAQFTARAADDLAVIQQQLDLPAFLVAWYATAAPQDRGELRAPQRRHRIHVDRIPGGVDLGVPDPFVCWTVYWC